MHANERHWNAFISYAHEDVKMPGQDWTGWVRENLTSYKTPEEFVGLTGVFDEPVPDSMPNVFLDTAALANSGKLAPELEAHLKRSRVLVVLCSPKCALSEHTAREVACFKRQGRERGWTDEDTAKRIIVLVLEGEPYGVKGRECYPPPLAYDLKADGVTPDTDRPANPLYIDLRPHGPKGEVTVLRGATTSEVYGRTLRAEAIYSDATVGQMIRAYEDQLFDARIMLLSSALGLNHSELSKREILRIKEEVRRREAEAAKKIEAARRQTLWVAVVAFAFIALSGFLAFYVGETRKAQSMAEQRATEAVAAKGEAEESARNAKAAEEVALKAQQKAVSAEADATLARKDAEEKQAKAQAAAEAEKNEKEKTDRLLTELLDKCLWATKENDATSKTIVETLIAYYGSNEPAKEDWLGWGRYAQVLLRQGDLHAEPKDRAPEQNGRPPTTEELNIAEKCYRDGIKASKRALESKQPPNTWAYYDLANSYSRLAGILRRKAANTNEAAVTRASELLESIQCYQSSHSHFESETAINSLNSSLFWELPMMSREMGIAFLELSRVPEQDAKKYLGEAVAAFRRSKGEIEKVLMLFPNDPHKAQWEEGAVDVDSLAQSAEAEAAAR